VILGHHGGEGLALAAVLSGAGALSAGMLVARVELARLVRRLRRR
jgi:hypothetical protein